MIAADRRAVDRAPPEFLAHGKDLLRSWTVSREVWSAWKCHAIEGQP
ncbi:hypothetical protein MTP10_26940 [Nonomuraea sp. 3-1Str]|nr:hypothetical protein [Nonomuraea sp. 3-1Str]MDR8412358.1 hypothetical protein [Nonomuraea sp. 3-1Str]